MTYIGETFPEAPVRIGFPVGETPAEMAVIDAAADWCARKAYCVVSEYNSPAAIAAVRHAGLQIIVQRTDWKPKERGTLNPAPCGRIWDELWTPGLQAVVTASRRPAKVRALATHMLSLSLTCEGPGRIVGTVTLTPQEGDPVSRPWRGSEWTFPTLLQQAGIA